MSILFKAIRYCCILLISYLILPGNYCYADDLLNQQSTAIAAPAHKKQQVSVLAQQFTSHYSNIAKSLSLSPLAKNYHIANISLEDWQQQPQNSVLIVCLGKEPLKTLLQQKPQVPILASLITRQEWQEVTAQYPTADDVSAIFYDPDIKRQLVLGKLLQPLAKTVGIMYSEDNASFIGSAEAIVEQLKLTLETTTIKHSGEVVEKFPALAESSDFIVAVPNRLIYNAQTLPRVLLSSYRQRKVVIGYSTGMVKAGAIATTYTTPEMLIQDIEESISSLLQTPRLSFTRHSKYFDIKYNLEVARSLGLELISKEQLKSAINELERLNQQNQSHL